MVQGLPMLTTLLVLKSQWGRRKGMSRGVMSWSRNAERSLLCFGSLLLAIYAMAVIHRIVLSRAELQAYTREVNSTEPAHFALPAGEDPDVRLWSERRREDYQASLAAHFAPAIAVLRIPRIHLQVPVLDGTDELTLNRGVGHIVGTANPGADGNMAIAGHRDGFFRGLKDVGVGDRIEMEAPGGMEVYVIDRITIVDPSDVSVLEPTPSNALTLVTCYPFYFVGSAPQRYIVRASLASGAMTSANTSKTPSPR
jgi:sortase A